jgi:hypothetical protein
MSDPDAEDLIAHLCGGLAPAYCDGFRKAAETAVASSPQCWGPGSVYRTLVPLWRKYFRPPPYDRDRTTTWDQGRAARANSSARLRSKMAAIGAAPAVSGSWCEPRPIGQRRSSSRAASGWRSISSSALASKSICRGPAGTALRGTATTTTSTAAPAASLCAGHAQQLGGESPLPNLMEVKG